MPPDVCPQTCAKQSSLGARIRRPTPAVCDFVNETICFGPERSGLRLDCSRLRSASRSFATPRLSSSSRMRSPDARQLADFPWGGGLWGGELLVTARSAGADPYSYSGAGYPWFAHEWLGERRWGRSSTCSARWGLKLFKFALQRRHHLLHGPRDGRNRGAGFSRKFNSG